MRRSPFASALSLVLPLVALGPAACHHDAGETKPAEPAKSTSVAGASATPSTSASSPQGPLSDDRATATATRYVELLAAEKYDDAVALCDDDMAKAFPKEKAAHTWRGLVAQLGALKSTRVHKLEHKPPYIRATLAAKFEKDEIGLAVVVDARARVSGFFIVSLKAEVAWVAPDYVAADAFTEEEVVIGDGDFALPGTLTLPKKTKGAQGPFRALVLVHGSGPNDRDETVGGSKVFKDLAQGLASRGIAVLRYEKITRAHGKKVMEKWGDEVTLDKETTLDAVRAVALLKARPDIDRKRIAVLGHSQGGLAAPRIARADPEIAGVVVFAGPTRALEDIALAQFEYIATIPGANGEGAKEKLPAMREAVKLVKSKALNAKTPKETLPLGIPAPFWLDLRDYHPEALAAQLGRPILVLQGEADYQVTMDDFAGWKKALVGKPFARLQSFPGLMHTFADCGCKLAQPADYDKPAHVAKSVVDEIEKWVLGLGGAAIPAPKKP
jgi:hypothetical protein